MTNKTVSAGISPHMYHNAAGKGRLRNVQASLSTRALPSFQLCAAEREDAAHVM